MPLHALLHVASVDILLLPSSLALGAVPSLHILMRSFDYHDSGHFILLLCQQVLCMCRLFYLT